jgi:hypothetical protein
MARRFASTDTLQCSIGTTPTTRVGTFVVLVRAYDASFDALSSNTDLVTTRNGTTAVQALFLDTGKLFANNDFGAGATGPTDKTVWYVLAATKATGTVAYRYHKAAIGGAWTHTASGTSNDGSGATNILFGKGSIKATAIFEIAAAAFFTAALSDAAIEALGTSSMASWLAAGPAGAWQFNQASVATAVTDLTGHGANQTAISGTTVVADPAGWTYSGTTTPFTKTVTESYNVYNAWTKSVTESYRVTNAWTKSVAETYRVLNGFTVSAPESYRVYASFSKAITESYSVLAPWTKSITESYRVLASWSATVTERYRVLASWSLSAPEAYRVLGAWSLAVSDQYRVLNSWSLSAPETYRVLGGWSKAVAESYRVYAAWSLGVTERYDVLSGTAFSLHIDERYRILGPWSASVAERYSVLNGWSVVRPESYRVLNAWALPVAERYRVLNAWSLAVAESYSILGASWSLSVTERYRVYASWLRSFTERYNVGEVSAPVIPPDAVARLAALSTVADLRRPGGMLILPFTATARLGSVAIANLDDNATN